MKFSEAKPVWLSQEELHLIYDALDKMLTRPCRDSQAFLAELDTNGLTFRRRAEYCRARISELLR